MIRLQDVSIAPQGARQPVLKDVTFALERGAFCWLTGASGSGKSLLMRLLCLHLPPSSGSMTLLGQEVDYARGSSLDLLRQRIGAISQTCRLVEEWSVFDNVALPLRLSHLPRRDVMRETSAVLNWIGLGDAARRPAGSLSAGDRQCTAIARALIGRPPLILADEPVLLLDEDRKEDILSAFLRFAQQGTTVLVATHDQDIVERLPAPTLRLQDGRLRELPAA